MRKQFVPPLKKKKSDSENEDDKKKASKKNKKKKEKKQKKQKESKKESKKESVGVTKADMRPHREGVVSSSEGEGGEGEGDDQLGNLPTNSNLARINSSHHAHISSAMSELTTSTSIGGSSSNAYLSPELILEYSKPTTIHHFLTVQTILGEKVSKNFSTNGKLHQGYKVRYVTNWSLLSMRKTQSFYRRVPMYRQHCKCYHLMK